MHLLFVDESGAIRPNGKTSGAKYFVLGGVVVPESVWKKLAVDLKDLKKAYSVAGEVKWRHFSPSNTDKDNPMLHLSIEERREFRKDLFGQLTQYKSIRFIAVIVDIERAYEMSYINVPEDIYVIAYKQLSERFQYHLQDQSREVGTEINGIIILDNRGNQDDSRMRVIHDRMVNTDSANTSKFANLIEGLFIGYSHLSVGLQFADIVAGSVFRLVEKEDVSTFALIEPSFRRSPNGKIEGYGLVRWPKR